MTRTDIAISEMSRAIKDARSVARDEAGNVGLTQVLLTLEAETQSLRNVIHLANAPYPAQYQPCEE
jgi:hypothetical protein